MSVTCKIASLVMLMFMVLPAITLWGQGEESSGFTSTIPAPGLNDQQKRGENLFLQNCPLCHIASNQKKRLGIPTPQLKGLFKNPTSEDAVRRVILQGVPGRMPGFQYDLDAKEIDSIIAYLKTL
jgi:mono/diheme cytochrome c family protein